MFEIDFQIAYNVRKEEFEEKTVPKNHIQLTFNLQNMFHTRPFYLFNILYFPFLSDLQVFAGSLLF